MSPLLKKMKETITLANKEIRSKMNNLVHTFSINHFDNYEEKIKCSQFEWECLNAKKAEL